MNVEAMNSVSKTAEVTAPSPQKDVSASIPELFAVEAKPVVAPEPFSEATEAKNEEKQSPFSAKDPTLNTIDSVVSKANSRLFRTRCEYSYDETTRRVSIKVFDKESEELIREVPPEESLEMLRKMWEMAGIVVDEKR